MQEIATETAVTEPGAAAPAASGLRGQVETLERRLRQRDDQRRAMLHILADYEQDRRRLARQTERLDNSRRALLHILQDSHNDKLHLEASRKAMIHIMGDLRETTAEMQQREQELRDKQEQLVQAGKLATLGELTTGVAHELNNPLNNTGLFVGNAIDFIELGVPDKGPIVRELRHALQQVGKATEIISHLRTFGRAAPVSREPISVKQVIDRALALTREQLRLRQIEVMVDLGSEETVVMANPIQLEQVFINLLTNARDAVADSPRKAIRISSSVGPAAVEVAFADSGPGIPPGLEQRIFDPFFTTKEVGKGTGLGLSITYGIVKEHGGTISVVSRMITGHGEYDLAALALRGGAYDFIQKPIDRDDFVGALNHAIQSHALNRRVKDRRSALERCASELERIVEEFGRVPATPTSSEP
ncbi:MAG: two-component sensor histidine kinase [Candidatus Rokuibacteriota bacterium]|nr:MAG: two-component sensor histidine kinase [Candidatus Rokubacteria bacterium]